MIYSLRLVSVDVDYKLLLSFLHLLCALIKIQIKSGCRNFNTGPNAFFVDLSSNESLKFCVRLQIRFQHHANIPKIGDEETTSTIRNEFCDQKYGNYTQNNRNHHLS